MSRGSALLTALFIMTLVAIAATAMSVRLQLDLHRAQLTLASDKLYLGSQVVTFWAMHTLATLDNHALAKGITPTIAIFPKKMQTAYPNLVITGTLIDLQSQFNLNNVSNVQWHAPFLALLNATQKDPVNGKILLHSLFDWIRPYNPEQERSKSVPSHTKQRPAYLPAHQAMQSPSELRLVSGFSSSRYTALEPYITALPETTPLNINHASKVLLASLGSGLNPEQVTGIIAARGENGFKDITQLNFFLQKYSIPPEQVTLESNYFLAVASCSTPELQLTIYTVLKRFRDNHGRLSITLLHESLNTL
jgi:general secretion pathway protein K